MSAEIPETATISKPQIMALQTLIAGAHALQKTGMVGLHEAEALSIAVKAFVKDPQAAENPGASKSTVVPPIGPAPAVDPNEAMKIKQQWQL